MAILCTTAVLNALQGKKIMLTSSYTSIDQRDCITLDSDNMGSIQECESFNHIGVKVIEGDIRQSIILSRDREEYDLNFSEVVSPTFSSLGFKIEWRHELGNPENLLGMIVRFEVNNQYDDSEKASSYLVVSKIVKDEMCIIAKVLPQNNQNKRAREILDSKNPLPCLKMTKTSY